MRSTIRYAPFLRQACKDVFGQSNADRIQQTMRRQAIVAQQIQRKYTTIGDLKGMFEFFSEDMFPRIEHSKSSHIPDFPEKWNFSRIEQIEPSNISNNPFFRPGGVRVSDWVNIRDRAPKL